MSTGTNQDERSRAGTPVDSVSVTLPGSASLGAFEAGGVSALAIVLEALRQHDHEIRVAAVGGSSAGAIVGMLAVHAFAAGRDVASLLRAAWVDEVDATLLRSGGSDAPFAFDDLREQLLDFLDDTDEHPYGSRELPSEPIALHVSLTSLLGFTASTPMGANDADLLTYSDWAEFEIEPDARLDALTEPAGRSVLDAVLASASHPGAFRPRLVDRDLHELRERGVTPIPDDRGGADGDTRRFWYTDGGLVESEPASRIVRAAGSHRLEGRHLHLVIDPRSSGPSGDEQWADPDAEHTWGDGVTRALSILPTQALHDDLRHIADLNGRRRRLDDLMARLADAEPDIDLGELQRDIEAVAGLTDVGIVDVDMISPLLLARRDDGAGVNDLLAGDFIGAFGGFLDRSIRRSDYALGWRCTRAWVDQRLASHGIGDDVVADVLDALDAAEPDAWNPAFTDGGSGVDQLDGVGRWELFLVLSQFARVVTREAVPSLGLRERLPWQDAS